MLLAKQRVAAIQNMLDRPKLVIAVVAAAGPTTHATENRLRNFTTSDGLECVRRMYAKKRLDNALYGPSNRTNSRPSVCGSDTKGMLANPKNATQFTVESILRRSETRSEIAGIINVKTKPAILFRPKSQLSVVGSTRNLSYRYKERLGFTDAVSRPMDRA
ncbi:hypothetical protein GCM10008012_14780 [Rhizobium anhuiense]|nr:hypothetical protein GCM10008012_14780 [Rhizobium anhuiense]